MDTERLMRVSRESCRDEYRDYLVYSVLSRSRLVPERLRERLREMAEQEKRHYEFWKSLAGECRVEGPRTTLETVFFRLVTVLMGVTFTIKLLERHERDVIELYKSLETSVPAGHIERYREMVLEEEAHEEEMASSLEEDRVRYLGFTVLGLSDALIEIAGIHAGTLGVYSDTVKAGLAGLVAGVAASIAMASAAYAQAKQLRGVGRPSTAAMYTGVAYLLTAFLLAMPYFLIHDILLALLVSLALSIAVLAYTSLYSMVLLERSFTREMIETTSIIFGATAVLYLFGELVRRLIGLQI